MTWTAEEEDCCRWFGVTCNNQTGHVAELYISHCNLGGEISHALLNLSNLIILDLSYNSFHGTIPTFIGLMTRLRYLTLHYNNLNGIIPRSFGSLTNLMYLDLSYNSLYGFIPPEFGNLTYLQELVLESIGRCEVENLNWLSHLSHLEELRMDGISLAKQNHWVDVMLSLRKLSYLSLDGCELSQVVYPYSSSFLNSSSSSIHTLSLPNNNLTSTMYSWLFPLTSNKLRVLYLSYNMLDGIPEYFSNLCSLEWLDFVNNSVVVKFPDFLNNLSGCTSLTLQWLGASYNQFTGGSISENIGKSKAFTIFLSENPLQGVPSTNHLSNLSYVEFIDMSSCDLGPRFPKWIQTLINLTCLHISNASISDTIPLEFWDSWPSKLRYLNLSSNNIKGEAADLLSNFDNNSVIDLSSNRFYGTIQNVSSAVALLNLSKNKFSGGISFLCQMVDGFLEFLDLSHNFLIGQLPDCLWHFKNLKVLNLGHNNLSGRLPSSIGSLMELEALYLYMNNFSGELPLSLKNCTSLNSLNLGANKFSGNVPVWIGENLSRLYVLILKSNNFFGTIPLQVCQLPNLQILDISRNNLHGSIPSCLNNLTSMVQQGILPTQNIHSILTNWYRLGVIYKLLDGEYVDHAMIGWQGEEREFTRNLGLLKTIDLSSNNLTGGIPSSMSQMTLLNDLDVSYNRLSRRIPSSTQLEYFEPSRYDGNLGLCGRWTSPFQKMSRR
ncbi:unnamed protein product [Lactuca saligna]|uniref:Leucine-rich repeat-containing N-terminal plant-type domain-containing protein n=1 Tax=Lactuca saligna TaxID=75948 RepID=A0AA35ZCR5_LACSI|nr:unnamed protein product [Lactuca saligna]